MLSKKLIIILTSVVAAFLILIVIFLSALAFGWFKSKGSDASEYSAVYLTSGDIYYGKLSWFLGPHLKNVWFLQRGVGQNNQPQFGVVPFANSFWGPVDELDLNPRQILFWTHLRNDSQLVQAFGNPQLLQQIGQQQTQLLPGQSQSTSTFKGPSAKPPSK